MSAEDNISVNYSKNVTVRPNDTFTTGLQRRPNQPHYPGLPFNQIDSEWMLRTNDDPLAEANYRYLAMLKGQAPQPNYTLNDKMPHTLSSSSAAQSQFTSVIDHGRRVEGWPLMGRGTGGLSGDSLELGHPAMGFDHQKDGLWAHRVRASNQPHPQLRAPFNVAPESRLPGRPYGDGDQNNGTPQSWLDSKMQNGAQGLYRIHHQPYAGNSTTVGMNRNLSGDHVSSHEHNYSLPYTATSGQVSYSSDVDRKGSGLHTNGAVPHNGVIYRANEANSVTGNIAHSRDGLIGLPHDNQLKSIMQRNGSVVQVPDAYEMDTANYANCTGEVLDIERHTLGAAVKKPKNTGRLALHRSKALISVLQHTPIET